MVGLKILLHMKFICSNISPAISHQAWMALVFDALILFSGSVIMSEVSVKWD